MIDHEARTSSGAGRLEAFARELERELRGRVILPRDASYDEARRVYNAMIDRRPAVIARCRGVADILASLEFSQAHGLAVAIRGSGHSAAGHAVCDYGLVIDLSEMRSIRVDPHRLTASAEPGVTWSDFDHETQAFGLATPGGTVSSTSIAGLTLGGGIGWLMGPCGLTCDNLLAADVITAEGRLIHASETENRDLLWALRGGGGNFGIVSRFEFQLHPVTSVIAGSLLVPVDRAADALRSYRDLASNMPDEVTLCPTFFTTSKGERYLSMDLCFLGSDGAGMDYARLLADRLRPVDNSIRSKPYLEWQKYLDPLFSERLRGYWKSAFLDHLDDSVIGTIVEHYSRAPSRKTALILENFHGVLTRVSASDSAYGNRHKPFSVLITTRWESPDQDAGNRRWADSFYSALSAYTDGSGYLNYLGFGEEHRVPTTYGESTHRRLMQLKQKYDPENFFRHNHNIRPLSSARG